MLVPLKFINRSQSTDTPEILIFQKNVATDINESVVAWKVIQYCGVGSYHPFFYSTELEVGIADDYGNFSRHLKASNGSVFNVTQAVSGRQISNVNTTPGGSHICIKNSLLRGAVTVNIYLNQQLLASKTCVAPGQKALFAFEPTLWIGVMSQLVQGTLVDSAIISDINTEISLLGVASASIVLTGGGPGPDALPYTFTLEDVKRF